MPLTQYKAKKEKMAQVRIFWSNPDISIVYMRGRFFAEAPALQEGAQGSGIPDGIRLLPKAIAICFR